MAWVAGYAPDGRPAPQEQLGDEPRVQPDHLHVVAQVVEMRNTAVAFGEVTARCGNVERGHTVPDHPHGDLGIEVKTAGGASLREGGAQGLGRINAKAKERVAYGAAERLEMREADAQLAPLQP